MPPVTNTLKTPAGVPVARGTVEVRLIAATSGYGEGWVAGGQYSVLSRWHTQVDAAGMWTVDLVPNSLITPVNTYYQVIETGESSSVTSTVVVPNGAGPYWVGSILADPPGALGATSATHAEVTASTAAAEAYADAHLATHTAIAAAHHADYAISRAGGSVTVNADGSITLAPAAGKTLQLAALNGIGVAVPTHQLEIVNAAGEFPVSIMGDLHAIAIRHSAWTGGEVADLGDITLMSTGDAWYVLHRGGAPVGYGGGIGGSAAFNGLVPNTLDSDLTTVGDNRLTATQGWGGNAGLNDRDHLNLFVGYGGAQRSRVAQFVGWSDYPTVYIQSQSRTLQAGYSPIQRVGESLWIDHDGTAAALKLEQRGNSFTNATIAGIIYDQLPSAKFLLAATVNGEANSMYTLRWDGREGRGAGGASAQDVYWQRHDVGIMAVDKGIMARCASGDNPQATVAFSTIRSGENQTRLQIRHDATIWAGPGGNAAVDTDWYRAGVGLWKTDHKFVAAQGLGVGNSAAATAVGNVVRKVQLFDASGTALGYVPVYDAIT